MINYTILTNKGDKKSHTVTWDPFQFVIHVNIYVWSIVTHGMMQIPHLDQYRMLNYFVGNIFRSITKTIVFMNNL